MLVGNYWKKSINKMLNTYFYNASHLNKNGSELFSIMLANDLDSLGIVSNCDFN